MQRIAEAVLQDGTRLPYVVTENPPNGTMKYTYFSPDRSYVVQFFKDAEAGRNAELRNRISAIIGKYNPTIPEEKGGAKGNTEKLAEYFSDLFCWPFAVVVAPEFGIVCPAYPSNYFFGENASNTSRLSLAGTDKKSRWFTSSVRKYLNNAEFGNFKSMLKISISLARAVRRMHSAGLAHSDLSGNNVLIDPKTGGCIIIDIDGLVVPGIYPPEVVGTKGYIAPEIITSAQYPHGDSRRCMPCIETDLHSMAVLIYEYLFKRHPFLSGKMRFPQLDPEEEDFMLMGKYALFVENPYDRRNRPDDIMIPVQAFGGYIEKLFMQVFVDGLHEPKKRPTAMDWERGLLKSWELLYPCENSDCGAEWFVLHDEKNPVCPYCRGRIKDNQIVKFRLKKEINGRKGLWVQYGETVAYNNKKLYAWHVYSDVFDDEKASHEVLAHIVKSNGQWFIVNDRIEKMRSADGKPVPMGKSAVLRNGDFFRISEEKNGSLIEVSII